MTKILAIRSAATGDASVSNQLVDAYLARHADAQTVIRDLDANPVPHVKGLLGFIGITDVEVITAEGMAFGPDAAAAAVAEAIAKIAALA